MPVFEITEYGFDGGTDETDHLVHWVRAPNKEEVKARCDEVGIKVLELQEIDLDTNSPGVIDLHNLQ